MARYHRTTNPAAAPRRNHGNLVEPAFPAIVDSGRGPGFDNATGPPAALFSSVRICRTPASDVQAPCAYIVGRYRCHQRTFFLGRGGSVRSGYRIRGRVLSEV